MTGGTAYLRSRCHRSYVRVPAVAVRSSAPRIFERVSGPRARTGNGNSNCGNTELTGITDITDTQKRWIDKA